VSALITGIEPAAASRSTSLWSYVRTISPCTKRDSTFAVSSIVSPRPSWMSLRFKNSGLPPSSCTPTSNETRVRVLDLEKIKAHVCPASAVCGCRPRCCFRSRVSAKTSPNSRGVKSVSFRKCFIGETETLNGTFRRLPEKIFP